MTFKSGELATTEAPRQPEPGRCLACKLSRGIRHECGWHQRTPSKSSCLVDLCGPFVESYCVLSMPTSRGCQSEEGASSILPILVPWGRGATSLCFHALSPPPPFLLFLFLSLPLSHTHTKSHNTAHKLPKSLLKECQPVVHIDFSYFLKLICISAVGPFTCSVYFLT